MFRMKCGWTHGSLQRSVNVFFCATERTNFVDNSTRDRHYCHHLYYALLLNLLNLRIRLPLRL